MKKTALFPVVFLVLAISVQPAQSAQNNNYVNRFPKGSLYLTGLMGLNSYAATEEPFDAMPFPLGAEIEFYIVDNIAIGSTHMFYKWSDYLGIFGGRWNLRLYKPSLYLKYIFKEVKGLSFFTGANLGYNVFSISNQLGNYYEGDLESGLFMAPFIGAHLNFWGYQSGFLSRLFITIKVNWSVVDDFNSVYGSLGISYRFK